jgi:hypothetical protein
MLIQICFCKHMLCVENETQKAPCTEGKYSAVGDVYIPVSCAGAKTLSAGQEETRALVQRRFLSNTSFLCLSL